MLICMNAKEYLLVQGDIEACLVFSVCSQSRGHDQSNILLSASSVCVFLLVWDQNDETSHSTADRKVLSSPFYAGRASMPRLGVSAPASGVLRLLYPHAYTKLYNDCNELLDLHQQQIAESRHLLFLPINLQNQSPLTLKNDLQIHDDYRLYFV